ncbi:hypothetical protein HHI36_007710 [Cryptolaemus montrouzieri]|uniref:NadR/Ttd14 AAA domain-containing protein n=1 Tax=Cryptolaemus montrouzieri TaxID=559131 RepID=A0ABD2MQI6_9CUCU
MEDKEMENSNDKICYKLVLTGGPCGGKTTGQTRLCTFFENLGWKVFRVPETASVLLSGGIKFSDLSEDEVEIGTVSLLNDYLVDFNELCVEDGFRNIADHMTVVTSYHKHIQAIKRYMYLLKQYSVLNTNNVLHAITVACPTTFPGLSY